MKSITVAVVLALTLLSASAHQIMGQSTAADRKAPAVFTGSYFSMACGYIEQVGWLVHCGGGSLMEFRIWDVKSPARVTLIKATTVQFDLSTGEVRPEANVSITIENVPNRQTKTNRTLILPAPSN
jgi:hypothetical protein